MPESPTRGRFLCIRLKELDAETWDSKVFFFGFAQEPFLILPLPLYNFLSDSSYDLTDTTMMDGKMDLDAELSYPL